MERIADLTEVAYQQLLDCIPKSLILNVGDRFARVVMEEKMAEALVLLQKQAAYGPHNIGRPPNGVSPQVALVVRINDKVQRLGTLLSSGEQSPQGSEPRLDTWGDIANYGTIGTIIEKTLWYPAS
jgi:hypothetical protein